MNGPVQITSKSEMAFVSEGPRPKPKRRGAAERSAPGGVATTGPRPAVRAVATLGVILVALVASASGALAGKCGGVRVCACGDRVMEDYQLPGNLGPCPDSGLRIGARVVFDGGGHSILGSGLAYGLRVGPEGNGSEVRDVAVSGFRRGLRLVGARGVRLIRIEAHHNGDAALHKGYGIDVAKAASENVLEQVRVHHNADEGIHVGSGTEGNRIVDSDVFENYRENVYFLAGTSNTLEDSRLSGGTAAAVYIKQSKGTLLRANRIEDRPVQIRGDSRDTLLEGNSLHGAGIVLQEYRSESGVKRPRGTRIVGGGIRAPRACVRVDAARGTELESLALRCDRDISVGDGSDVRVSGVGSLRVACLGEGRVVQTKSLEFRVTTTSGEPPAQPAELLRAGEVVAASDAQGWIRFAWPHETIECPGARRHRAQTAQLRAFGETRDVPVAEIAGERRMFRWGEARAEATPES